MMVLILTGSSLVLALKTKVMPRKVKGQLFNMAAAATIVHNKVDNKVDLIGNFTNYKTSCTFYEKPVSTGWVGHKWQLPVRKASAYND